MKLRCLEAFWILSTVRLSMRPWNPKLKLRKTQIDLTGSTFRKIHSRVVPKKRDPRNLGCSQSPRKKRDPQKNPSGRDPREFPIGPQGPPTKILIDPLRSQKSPFGQQKEKWCKHFENAKQATWATKRKMMQTFWKCKASHLGNEKNNDANLFSSLKPKTKNPFSDDRTGVETKKKESLFVQNIAGKP